MNFCKFEIEISICFKFLKDWFLFKKLINIESRFEIMENLYIMLFNIWKKLFDIGLNFSNLVKLLLR